MAAELISSYDTAACASLRAAITLDGLAAAIDARSMLAATRTPARPPASKCDVADDDSVHQQALPVPPGVARQLAGQIEHMLHGLQITEPVMLLRAAAIDDGA